MRVTNGSTDREVEGDGGGGGGKGMEVGGGGGEGSFAEEVDTGAEHLTTVKLARLAVAALFIFFLLNLGFFAIVFRTFA